MLSFIEMVKDKANAHSQILGMQEISISQRIYTNRIEDFCIVDLLE